MITPGPWEMWPHPTVRGSYILVGPLGDGADRHTVAQVLICDDGTHPDRAKDDARFIVETVNAARGESQ